MKRPRMSTGAWIFASVIAAAIVTPTAVYAAATSTMAIGNTHNATTATVTANHQLLTTTIVPRDVVHAHGLAFGNGCVPVYTPPAGEAIVVTSVTYDMFGNTAGGENFAALASAGCNGTYDGADTDQIDETESRTFPTGLPMPSVALYETGTGVFAWITGYLIPASQLPAAAPATKLPARLPHPTH